jgi:hypothetical protein
MNVRDFAHQFPQLDTLDPQLRKQSFTNVNVAESRVIYLRDNSAVANQGAMHMKQSRILTACGVLTMIAALAVWAPQARGVTNAFDDACNDTMSTSSNGGYGFLAWSNVGSQNSGTGGGTYQGTGLNGNGCNTDWGLYNGCGSCSVVWSAQRGFNSGNGTNALQPGQAVIVDMANGGVNGGGSEGLSLWNSGGSNVWELYFSGGSSTWTISDNSGTYASSLPYETNVTSGTSGFGVRAIFKLTSATTYIAKLQTNATGGGTTWSYTNTVNSPGGNSGGPAITQLRFFTYDIGGGNNLQVNDIAVVCTDTLTFTEQPISESAPTNDIAVFTVANFGDSVTYQWQSATSSNGTYTAISGATNSYSITATNYESSYVVAATTANNNNWYRCIATDACSNTVTSGSAQLTLSSSTAPVITAQPASTTVCSNSTASFSVTASGTAPGYDWLQHSNAGWGSGYGWSVVASNASSGVYVGSSTNNDGSSGYCTGFGNQDINSPSPAQALGMYGPKIAVQRVFPSTVSAGQWFSIDMDNGNVDTGAQNGFALHTGLPNTNGFLLSFYFLGGQSNYKFSDASGEHDTGIHFTRTGLRVQILVGNAVGGTNSYSLFISTNQCGAATAVTNVFSGTFVTNGPPGAVTLFNNNNEGGAANDLFFNNIIAGGAYDNADNYSSGNWANGGNGGDLPIGGATSSSYSITAQSNATYYVIVTNAVGAVVSSTAALTVNPNPTISTATPMPGGVVGTAYNQTIAASSGTTPYTFSVSSGSLPTGLSLTSSSGLISGTPTAVGTYNFTATVTDHNGCTGSSNLSITVSCPTITLSPTSLPSVNIGVAYSQQLSASGGTGSSYTFAVTSGSLPSGLTLSSSGLLSGTYNGSAGSASFTVTATNTSGAASGCTGSQAYTLTLQSCPTITLSPGGGNPQVLTAGTVQTAYSATITASGSSNTPYTYTVSSGSLPSGLSLASSTGVISGTPTTSGTFTFTVMATDTVGCSGTQNYSLTINCPTITLSPNGAGTNLTAGTVGASYSRTFTATGANGSYTWSKSSGTLPTGLSLSSGGVLSGTPTAAGTYTFTILATDSSGCTGSLTYNVTMTCPTITVNPAALPCGSVGTAYSTNVWASGGTGPYTFSVSAGSLPTGLSLTSSSGLISGTPSASGAFSFTIQATDADNCVGSNSYTVSMCGPPSISVNPTNEAVCSGSSASLSVTASGTSLQYFWRQRGSGWGTNHGWSFNLNGGGDGTNGTFIGDSSINAGGSGTHSNINSSAGTAFGMYANSGKAVDAYRAFGSLAVGQTIQVDIENGWVSSGGPSVGFGIQNSIGTNLWEFFFVGGNNNYTMNDASGANTNNMPPYTANGLRVTFTLTSSNTYSATITTPNTGGTTYGPYTGTLITPFSGTQVPAQLHFWNANSADGSGGSAYDFFFNNLYVDGVPGTQSVALYSDDAANYTNSSEWTGGSNLGQGPIGSVLPTNTEFSGTNTATLTIDPASSADAANYDVVVTNSCGGVRSGIATLTVNPIPTVMVNSATICAGASATLTATTSGNSPSYLWSPGGATTASITVSPASTTTYTVTVTDGTTGCANSGSGTVTVNPLPTFTYSQVNETCNGQSIGSITVSASGGSGSYTYSDNNGSSYQSGNVFSNLAAGSYTVLVQDSNGCVSSPQTVTITQPTALTCLVSPPSAAICAGGSQMFTVTPSGGAGGYTYLWNTGATTPSIAANGSGTYTVTVTDANGCTTTCSATLTVNPLPTVSVNSATVCAGTSATLTATTSANTPSYLWNPGGATTASITVSPVSTTTYTVTVIDGTTGCTNSGDGTVTVNPTPDVPTASNNGPIIEGNTLDLTASTVSNTTYSWTGPNGFTSTEQNPSIFNATSAASGTYTVTVTGTNGCTASNSTAALVTALSITSITVQGNDIYITWATTGGTTNVVQSTLGTPDYNANFADITNSLTIVGGIGDTTTNYEDVGAATNAPAKYYRIRLVP